MGSFEKRREPPAPGSIPEALDMFRSEVRFYRDIAPVLRATGIVRVPACEVAELAGDGSTRLVLENLSALRRGAEATAIAAALRRLHDAFADGTVVDRWPWLRRVGAAADLIGALYDSVWADSLAARADLPPSVRALGTSLLGRVADAEWAEGSAGPLTLCHGDPSARNVFTDGDGEVVFVDWEDVRVASGVVDLAWLLVSSVEPPAWPDVIDAYGRRDDADADDGDLVRVLPSVSAQGFLALAGAEPAEAAGWIDRLGAAAEMLGASRG